MGTDRTAAMIICVRQSFLENSNLSDNFVCRIKITIMATNDKRPASKQNGINLGYCFVIAAPSSEIAMLVPNKFRRHSKPRLKNVA